MSHRLNRRRFMQAGAAGLGYLYTGPAFSVAQTAGANDRVRVAGVGVGGKGSSDIEHVAAAGTEIVALCDIDDNSIAPKAKKWGQAKTFADYRKLFDDTELLKNIDAVTVSTPDHHHALVTIQAMRAGKHVYTQKPLTHTVFEARLLRDGARKYKVVTQMGNQGTATNGLRRAVEYLQGGGIGAIKEAHVWTNRPIWPQAPYVTTRPAEKPVPNHIHWDEFIGPAPFRPFAKYDDSVQNRYSRKTGAYHDFHWRGWWDFGTGAVGDMACHTANMLYMALRPGLPVKVSAEAGDVNPETCSSFAHVTLTYPAVTVHWYEGAKGGKNVLPAAGLVKGQGKRDKGFAVYFETEGDDANKWVFANNGKKVKVVNSGSFLIGDKATLFSPDDYGADSYIVTPDGVERLTGEPTRLPQVATRDNDQAQKNEWVAAIKAGKPEGTLANFEYGSQLTESFLLGNVAIRSGQSFEYDGGTGKIKGSSEAEKLLHFDYRKGWDMLGEKA